MERYHSNGFHPNEERQTEMPQQSSTSRYASARNEPSLRERESDDARYTSRRRAPARVVTVIRPDARRETYKKPWYNQGWVWLIVAGIGLAVLWLALSGLTEEASKINGSVQEQTGVLRQQNHVLASIRDGMNGIRAGIGGLTQAIENGFDRLIAAIQNAVK